MVVVNLYQIMTLSEFCCSPTFQVLWVWLEEKSVNGVVWSWSDVILGSFVECKCVFVFFFLVILEWIKLERASCNFVNVSIFGGRSKCWDFNVEVTSNLLFILIEWNGCVDLPIHKVIHWLWFLFFFWNVPRENLMYLCFFQVHWRADAIRDLYFALFQFCPSELFNGNYYWSILHKIWAKFVFLCSVSWTIEQMLFDRVTNSRSNSAQYFESVFGDNIVFSS